MQGCCFHDAMQEENNVILAKVITTILGLEDGLDPKQRLHASQPQTM
jgi:hypothetical protein